MYTIVDRGTWYILQNLHHSATHNLHIFMAFLFYFQKILSSFDDTFSHFLREEEEEEEVGAKKKMKIKR